jgi:putative aminopeptidase FrvX
MNFDLLKAICEAPGVPSREEVVRGVIQDAMAPLVSASMGV